MKFSLLDNAEHFLLLVSRYLHFLETSSDTNYTEVSVSKSRLFGIDILYFLLIFPFEKLITGRTLFGTRGVLSLNQVNAFLEGYPFTLPQKTLNLDVKYEIVSSEPRDKPFCLSIEQTES